MTNSLILILTGLNLLISKSYFVILIETLDICHDKDCMLLCNVIKVIQEN